MKTYMKPEVLFSEMELEDMIAFSYNPEKAADPNEEVLSRQDDSADHHSVWNDEE